VVARRTTVCIVAAAFVGCGGSRVTTGLQNTIPQTWHDAKRSALLYVSDPKAGTVFIYAYPSLKAAGMLTGLNLPSGLCVDQKTGNIWIAETTRVVEFAHGETKPIRTLQIGRDNNADACAVNPENGELAVANATFGGDGAGDVVIFNLGTGKSKKYYKKDLFYVLF